MAELRSRRADEVAALTRYQPVPRAVSAVAWAESTSSSACCGPATFALLKRALGDESARRTRDDYHRETATELDALLAGADLATAEVSFAEGSGKLFIQPREPSRAPVEGSGWPWNTAKIGKWFAQAVDWGGPGVTIKRGGSNHFGPGLLDLRKRAKPHGRWSPLEEAGGYLVRQTVTHSGQDYSSKMSTTSVYVLQDGRVIQMGARDASALRNFHPVELSALDLRTIGIVLGLDIPGGRGEYA